MKRFLAAVLAALTTGAIGRTAPAETAAASLSELFKPGVIFQDTNGDGAIDFVDARLVLPDQPDPSELAAAANIAARLGFETSALNIPLAVARRREPSDTGPTIFIGAKSLAASDVTAESICGLTSTQSTPASRPGTPDLRLCAD